MSEVILKIKNLSKSFPGVLAVNKANLEIESGKVHSLVGGNGAGKSTLMKILAGIYSYGNYEGSFFLNDAECQFKSIVEAENCGISMVPQDLNMVNEMSIADNLFINKQPRSKGIINDHKMLQQSQQILDEFGLNINPTTLVKEIGIAQKQLLVIARAMHNKTKVLILDEPTSTLSSEESQLLFQKIVEAKSKGVACIYISHRLDEVKAISDTITVMRDGCIIETDNAPDMSEKRIVSLMVGRDVDDFYPPKDRTPASCLLKVNSLSVYNQKFPDKKVVDDIQFDLYAGEILAVYGLVGAGRTEMAMGIIGGWRGGVSCDMEISGKKIINRNPSSALNHGIALLPEDRKREGAIDRQSVSRNISASSLPLFSKFGVIDEQKERNNNQKMVDALSIKTPSMDTAFETLSGGNQQKAILSRLISTKSKILILDEATQGIDVEAKYQIYGILDLLALDGKAILFISSDIAEVMGIADRIMIMRHGKVVKTVVNDDSINKEKILWYATIGTEES
ncbi:sugar ABC transporter ATP-binding protein [Clostridiales bacterium COT073_COT-073]|nr:sugar ABC transporter ATP-binding protein [Clostridiales bacterium COT073_COT-073]